MPEQARELPDGWLDRAGVARLWGVSAHYVTDAARDGRLPPPDAYAGRSPLWRRATVESAMEHRNRPGPRPRAVAAEPADGPERDIDPG